MKSFDDPRRPGPGRKNRAQRPAGAIAVLLILAACSAPPAPPPREAPVEDEWSQAPSPAWLVATHGVPASHEAECKAAFSWLERDEGCVGASCERAASLAKDWTERCSKIDRTHAARAKELGDELGERAKGAASTCATQADEMLREGCTAAACLRRAQAWATRCAAAEKSPLTLRFLERLVERKTDALERLELDARSCDEFGLELLKGAVCRDEFACADAFKKFDVVKERCTEPDQRPTIAVGAVAVSLAAGAGQKPPRIPVRRGADPLVAKTPVPLGDGSGLVVSICGARPATVADYDAARATCKKGTVIFARAFQVTGSDGLEVRHGVLEFPDDATFEARFPTLHAAGEVEARDRRIAGPLAAALGHAAAAKRGAAAFAELRAAFEASAERLRRATSPLAEDEALAPLFAELGRAKRARIGGSSSGEAAGILARGRTRPLADVDDKGAIRAGSGAAAGRIDVKKALPTAMRAYLAALDPSGRAAAPRVDAATAKKAHAIALERARTCGEAEKRLQAYKATVIACAFGEQTCSADKLAEATAAMDDSRAVAAVAWDAFDAARTGPAAEDAAELDGVARAAACIEPWW